LQTATEKSGTLFGGDSFGAHQGSLNKLATISAS